MGVGQRLLPLPTPPRDTPVQHTHGLQQLWFTLPSLLSKWPPCTVPTLTHTHHTHTHTHTTTTTTRCWPTHLDLWLWSYNVLLGMESRYCR